MKKFLLLSSCILSAALVDGQDLSANKLLDMLTLTVPKLESQLSGRKYFSTGTELSGDTITKTYTYRTVFKNSKKKTSRNGKQKIAEISS